MNALSDLLPHILTIHNRIRDSVVAATERQTVDDMASIAHDGPGDTIYSVDKISEDLIVEQLTEKIAAEAPIVLIAEGIAGGELVLPAGADPEEALWRVIVDPIDGTRGLMYQKRSAWILTGVAPNKGPETSLADIELAVQTETPLVKQHLSDQVWVVKGEPVGALRHNRLTGEDAPLELQPSRADTIAHGFAYIARFFPGVREELAAIDEEIVLGALGPVRRGKAHCFEDQYISTGGQLYELMAGHDRFTADLRPVMDKYLAASRQVLGITCHPYDICTELIARTLGVVVTDAYGERLAAPLSVDAEVSWAGYANEAIREQIQPLLEGALRKRGLI